MLPPNADPPLFLIIAGPNGSGKSSIYTGVSIEHIGRSVWIINPDLLAARIRDIEQSSSCTDRRRERSKKRLEWANPRLKSLTMP